MPILEAHGVKTEPRKISKPRGEVTRLSRGGYSLEKTLGWEQKRYREVQVALH
jgi:hypothetical protein